VIVVYLDSAHAIHPRIAAFVSVDGGASWGPSSTIAMPRRAGRDLPVRDPGLPSVAIDERGAVYVAWSDCRFEPRCAVDDIVLSRSRGSGWASPILAVKGEPSTGTSVVTPGLAVRIRGPNTGIALVYYAVAGTRCERFRPCPCTVTVRYASSRDGGAAWSPPATIGWPMQPTWFPSTRPGFMWGDYVAAAIVGNGKALAVLPLARRPNEGALDVAMYASVRGLPIKRALTSAR
jgi:hypothetical protein